MLLTSFIRELRGGGSRRLRRGRAHIAPESGSELSCESKLRDFYDDVDEEEEEKEEESAWANLPPELIHNIIERVETSETTWPARRDVVACASVCKSWRDITKRMVKTPEQCGCLTFPISLKQPGPRDTPIQCFIKRERASATYQLYLGLSPALSGDMSKLLLAAKKIRKATRTEFRISFVGSDFCQTSNAYVGKLRSNFLGTKFTIYDTQPPQPLIMQSSWKPHLKIQLAQDHAKNYNVATIAYELNVLRTRGPRRMRCAMHSIPIAALQEGGTAPTPTELKSDQQFSPSSVSRVKQQLMEPLKSICNKRDSLILKNKAPRWHEQLQCWCLNFKGRVTVASVKNFQLVAAAETCENVPVEEQEKVILQFGKIGKDIFTMDYRYPLSAFQAFAICLSSFDTKPACE